MSDVPIMLYDGVCNLCNSSVRFVLKRDTKNIFCFAAIQSHVATELLSGFGVTAQLDTIYLVLDGKLYDRSSAALRIAAKLRFPWRLLAIFLIVPKPLRDAVYNWIGRNRYRWFGRTESCQIPHQDVRKYFLDLSED
ncbi:thiol-disulfide oxidoreductase DCC family protein [Kordiimonas aestuarii]|uniref:thiol-disulfide oxidoreductase DCC family protein n=1 Tax=Kordiimonas aestuarii TaxID=1005925 RepID=UPI0021D026DE|nr:DCC1-like thiol-disulfide oxidoreductase family protein [Kordiimonas aestuarii]